VHYVLSRLQSYVGARLQTMPPLQPQREYFYEIDLHGRLWHEGSELTDEGFLRFFFRHLRPNTTGQHPDYPYVVLCAGERNYVRCADTPIVFQRYADGQLLYAGGLAVAFVPELLRFSAEGILYHAAPVGEWGRLAPAALLELARWLEPWGPYYSLHLPELRFPVVIEPLEPAEEHVLLRPHPEKACIACGGANPQGMGLSFLYNPVAQSISTWVRGHPAWQGKPGVLHGGIIALLMDETMGKLLSAMGMPAWTRRLRLHYRAPVPVGARLHCTAHVLRAAPPRFLLKALLQEEQTQRCYAEALGEFVSHSNPNA
jgi:acyl-coenzyme A thioesterase PaaI-like protein